MKALLSTIILAIVSNICFAQLNPNWQFDNAAGYNYYPTTNIFNNGINTFVCSQSIDPLNIAYIYKLDDSGNLISQDSVHNFYYSFLDNKRMIADNDGDIYLCGNITDQVLNNKIRLIKFDQQLNRLWDITFIDSNAQTCTSTGLLYSSIEDRIYLIGEKYTTTDKTIIVKFDPSGNVLWESQDTLSSTFSLTAYAIDHNGNVVLGGYAFINGFGTGEDFIVSKTDTAGNLSWLNRENGSSNSDDWVFDLCIDNNNNIYASGVFEDTARYKFFKYDPSGNQIWIRNVPDAGLNKIATDPASSLYIVGFDQTPSHEFILRKFDASGNYIGETYSDIPNFNYYNQDYFVSIQTDSAANVYLLHSADSSSHLKWLIAKLDSSLNLQWSTTYPSNTMNPATPGSLCIVDDGIIVAGKIDTYLRVVHFEDLTLSAENTSLGKNELLLWPNPVREELNIKSTKLPDKNCPYKIYDLNMKIVSSGNLRFTNDHYYLNTSNLKCGMYFLLIENNDDQESRMFIVE